MKHKIRQRVINEHGLPVTKIETVNGELGSDFLDCNGKEFFEGDIFKFPNGSIYTVKFVKGCFVATDGWGYYGLRTLKTGEAEIIGHVDD